MKNKLLISFLVLTISASMSANGTKIDNVWYNLNSSQKTAEVTYNGYSYSNYSSEYSGNVAIPSFVMYGGTKYTVTSVGSSAFRECTSLTAVTLPSSVKKIDSYAFYGCISLTTISMRSDSITINYSAFGGCYFLSDFEQYSSVSGYPWAATIVDSRDNGLMIKNNVLVAYKGNSYSVTIPQGVVKIDGSAFYKNTNLSSITLPESLDSIGSSAFFGCSSLNKINIPSSVNYIGKNAFTDCNNLPITNNIRYADTYLVKVSDNSYSSYTIKDGTRFIGESAFSGCLSLYQISLPESITYIGGDAFYNCSSLSSITIPNSVTTIENYTFSGCRGLTSINIPSSVTTIGDWAFDGCSSLPVIDNLRYADTYLVEAVDKSQHTFTIRPETRFVNQYAFYGCYILKTEFAQYASMQGYPWGATLCESIENGCVIQNGILIDYIGNDSIVIVPEGVKTIQGYAFYDKGVVSVTLPEGLIEIGDYAFDGCPIRQINIPNSVFRIGHSVFAGNGSLPIIDHVRYADTYLVGVDDYSLSTYTIKEGTRFIGDYAFGDCRSLSSIKIPESVEWIGRDAFYSANFPVENNMRYVDTYLDAVMDKSLNDVTFKSGTRFIGNRAFEDCKIKTLTIPESICCICDEAFSNCDSLQTLYIPKNVKHVGLMIGGHSDSIRSIQVDANNPYYDSRNNCNAIIEKATQSMVTACKNTTYFPNGIEYIRGSVYYPVNPTTDVVVFPETVKKMENDLWGDLFYSTHKYVFHSLEPPIKPIGDGGFYPTEDDTLYVPDQSINAYKTAFQESYSPCVVLPLSMYSEIKISYADTAVCEGDLPLRWRNIECSCQGIYVDTVFTAGEISEIYHLTLVVNPQYGYKDTKIDTISINAGDSVVISKGMPWQRLEWPTQDTLFGDTLLTIHGCDSMVLHYIIIKDCPKHTICGQCGDSVYWALDTINNTLTISGTGKMYNYAIYGDTNHDTILAPWTPYQSMISKVIISNGVTLIGEWAFAGCTALADIYSYAVNPPIAFDNTFEYVSKHCYVHVPVGTARSYQLAIGWRDFYHIVEISALPDGTTEVGVTVTNNYATFSWPVNPTASSYTLEITKDGELFCTLIFNSLGQLVGMAFAPGQGHNAPAATSTSYGYSFVVTGLTDNTTYAYTFSIRDEYDNVIETKSGTFKTTGGTPTSVDEAHGSQPTMHKVLRNGQILLERNNATYTFMGQKVR